MVVEIGWINCPAWAGVLSVCSSPIGLEFFGRLSAWFGSWT